MNVESILRIENVSKKFGSFQALENLNIQLNVGEIVGLLGPNGAGKTTLMRLICGLTLPSSGQIHLLGKHSPGSLAARYGIGYMPQQLALYNSLTCMENIQFFGHLYGLSPEKIQSRSEYLLDMLELKKKQHELAANLSGGMRRRLMMATVLVHEPKLIIFDEPTAGVDPILRIKFWQWFEIIASEGASILITTHHIAEANRCHRVAFIKDGKLFLQGTPRQLLEEYQASHLEDVYIKAISRRS